MMKVMIEEELGYTNMIIVIKTLITQEMAIAPRNKSSAGEIEVNIPHDRNGEYESQVIKKPQNIIGQDLEVKIIST